MDRGVTYEYKDGGWMPTVRSNERKDPAPKKPGTGHPEHILVRQGCGHHPDGVFERREFIWGEKR